MLSQNTTCNYYDVEQDMTSVEQLIDLNDLDHQTNLILFQIEMYYFLIQNEIFTKLQMISHRKKISKNPITFILDSKS